jgi:putative ABC transport system permease protein
MALGAGRGEVVALVVSKGMKMTGVGVVLGVLVGLGLTRVMTRLLFGVTPSDPITFIGTSMILLLVALFASWLPARRAARVDPMVALRTE